jgi:hypothetical protein
MLESEKSSDGLNTQAMGELDSVIPHAAVGYSVAESDVACAP